MPLERKDTNPKDAIGSRKLPFHVFPMRVLAGVVLAFLEGALKYGSHNYRVAGVRATVYTDGAQRHITRFLEGEDWDPEVAGYAEGVRIHHIDKAIASLTVLRDSILQGNWVDDRPPAADEWMAAANRMAGLLIDSVSNPVAAYTEKGERVKPVPSHAPPSEPVASAGLTEGEHPPAPALSTGSERAADLPPGVTYDFEEGRFGETFWRGGVCIDAISWPENKEDPEAYSFWSQWEQRRDEFPLHARGEVIIERTWDPSP